MKRTTRSLSQFHIFKPTESSLVSPIFHTDLAEILSLCEDKVSWNMGESPRHIMTSDHCSWLWRMWTGIRIKMEAGSSSKAWPAVMSLLLLAQHNRTSGRNPTTEQHAYGRGMKEWERTTRSILCDQSGTFYFAPFFFGLLKAQDVAWEVKSIFSGYWQVRLVTGVPKFGNEKHDWLTVKHLAASLPIGSAMYLCDTCWPGGF